MLDGIETGGVAGCGSAGCGEGRDEVEADIVGNVGATYRHEKREKERLLWRID